MNTLFVLPLRTERLTNLNKQETAQAMLLSVLISYADHARICLDEYFIFHKVIFTLLLAD